MLPFKYLFPIEASVPRSDFSDTLSSMRKEKKIGREEEKKEEEEQEEKKGRGLMGRKLMGREG